MPHRRRFILTEPADPAKDPRIASVMVTTPMDIPDPGEFKGYIKEDDIGDLAKRDRKTVLALSVIEQWSDWQNAAIKQIHLQNRQVDAEVARLKLKLAEVEKEQAEQGWTSSIVKWLGVTIGAGIISALARLLIS